MKHVIKGVIDFQRNKHTEHRELFSSLANTQSPEVLFITCSDSRIDPNLVTQTLPGDLFVCRNAGHIVPPHSEKSDAMSASIEYAVAALRVKHIVICGHSNCGAMKGALDLSALDALPQVKDWLGLCCDAVDAVKARHSGAGIEHLDEVIEENINLQIKNLMSHPAVADKVNAGEVTIHGWVYDIESGAIKCKGDSGFESFEKHYADIIAELG